MTIRRLAHRAVPVGLLLAAGAAAPALAEHPKVLLARTPSGGAPNAPAADPAISGDGRLDRYAAYTSAATDIVPGSGPHRNVFLVDRKRPYAPDARAHWLPGRTRLASEGRGGPANGDSWGPAFDGYDYASGGRDVTVKPRCLAFVSSASNLVGGDGNGHADVFIAHLPSGRLSRIATPGPASEVALDGRCWTVAFVAGGTVYRKDLRHGGRARRISGPGGAGSPELSASGKVTTYSRNGVVYVNRVGEGGTHRVAAGTAPTADEFGRYVAYQYSGDIWRANTKGAAHARRLVPRGLAPSMTAGGSFVFFVRGSIATSTVYRDFGTCPAGTATQIAGSLHGNFAAYGCSTGVLYMSYIGPK